MKTYTIRYEYLDKLEKKLQTVAKKCAKFGVEFCYRVIGEVFKESEEAGQFERCVEVEVSGLVLHDGWKVIAKIDHIPAGIVIRKIVFDVEIPSKYLDNDYCMCEHCNTNRARKQVYILYSESLNEWKQVGATCLKEFTVGLSAETAAWLVSVYDELDDYEPNSYGSSYQRRYLSLEHFLYFVAEECEKNGYVSSSKGRDECIPTTGFLALVAMHKAANHYPEKAVVDKYENEVSSAMEWAKNNTDTDEYYISIRTLAHSGYIEPKEANFAASILRCYRIEQAKLKKAARKQAELDKKKVSEYQGNIGDKIQFIATSVKMICAIDGMYGTTYLYEFIDVDSNVYIWYASRALNDLSFEFKEATTFAVSGTVKNHEEYRGVKQTVLTRCKVAPRK